VKISFFAPATRQFPNRGAAPHVLVERAQRLAREIVLTEASELNLFQHLSRNCSFG
jgi:hypothetical protein